MIPGYGTQWDSAANGGVASGSPNGWDGSGSSAGQRAHGSITPEGADGDAAGHGSVWAAVTSFFSDLTRRQWLTYGGIAAMFFVIVIAGIIVVQLAVGRPPLSSPVGHSARQQQRQTTPPTSTPSATPTGSTPASPTSSASTASGTPTPTSGTPTPGTSGTASSPLTLPSPTPSTGSSGAARSTPSPERGPLPPARGLTGPGGRAAQGLPGGMGRVKSWRHVEANLRDRREHVSPGSS